VARLCNGLPEDKTMILSGCPFLWILGKYALGRMGLDELI